MFIQGVSSLSSYVAFLKTVGGLSVKQPNLTRNYQTTVSLVVSTLLTTDGLYLATVPMLEVSRDQAGLWPSVEMMLRKRGG